MTTLSTIDACTVNVRKQLEAKGFEVMVFHTLGTGGMAMDQIVGERDVANPTGHIPGAIRPNPVTPVIAPAANLRSPWH